MSKITLWDWDKKKRTMLRFIKPGHIFAFVYDESTYCFGRILFKPRHGTPSEIFKYTSDVPTIPEVIVDAGERMFHPINLDVYSLFDRKIEGEWRMIGLQEGFIPDENIYFWYGGLPDHNKIDVFGNELGVITKSEAQGMQRYNFQRDYNIKELVKANIAK